MSPVVLIHIRRWELDGLWLLLKIACEIFHFLSQGDDLRWIHPETWKYTRSYSVSQRLLESGKAFQLAMSLVALFHDLQFAGSFWYGLAGKACMPILEVLRTSIRGLTPENSFPCHWNKHRLIALEVSVRPILHLKPYWGVCFWLFNSL